jgi:hypothetical protein
MVQFAHLCDMIEQVQLTDHPNTFLWKLMADQTYSAAYAYGAMFFGSSPVLGAKHCGKRLPHHGFISSSGWFSMDVVGPEIGVSVMAYRRRTTVSCASKNWRQWITSYLAAALVARYGKSAWTGYMFHCRYARRGVLSGGCGQGN